MIYERVWIDNPEETGKYEYGKETGLGHVNRVSPAIMLERANAGLTRNRFFWISANLKKDIRGVDMVNYGLGVETWDRAESNHHRHRPDWDFHHPKFRGLSGIIPAAADGSLWLETGPLKEFFNGHTSVALTSTSTWRDRSNKIHISPEINAAVKRVQDQIDANTKRCKDESKAYNDALKIRLQAGRERIRQGLPQDEPAPFIVWADPTIPRKGSLPSANPSNEEWYVFTPLLRLKYNFERWLKKAP